MTRYAPMWLQGGSYPAIQDRMVVAAALGGGGVLPQPSFVGMVPTVVATSMNVQIAAGRCVVPVSPTDVGAYLCVCDASEVVTSPAAPGAGQNRYDLYIIRPRDPAVNATYTQNDWLLDVVPGTPSASPTPPTASSAPAGTVAVATCLVVGGQATLAAGNLTDLRAVLSTGGMAARAYRNAAYTTPGSDAAIPLDTVSFDPSGMFASSSLVAPVAGIYVVTGNVAPNVVANGRVNAHHPEEWGIVVLRWWRRQLNNYQGGTVGLPISDMVKLRGWGHHPARHPPPPWRVAQPECW